MHDCPAVPVVRGVIVIHEAFFSAVQVPAPDVRIDPPPPSLVNDRVGGSMLICPKTDDVDTTVSNAINIFFITSRWLAIT